MIAVPHDQPITIDFLRPRIAKMRSWTAATSRTAVAVSAKGGFLSAGSLIAVGPVERQIERGLRRVGSAVHEEQRALRRERGHVGRVLRGKRTDRLRAKRWRSASLWPGACFLWRPA